MICCALLFALVAPALWAVRRLARREKGGPLEWRPYPEKADR